MIEFKVEGMTCAHCVSKITRSINKIDDEAVIHANIATGLLQVEGDVEAEAVEESVSSLGYGINRL